MSAKLGGIGIASALTLPSGGFGIALPFGTGPMAWSQCVCFGTACVAGALGGRSGSGNGRSCGKGGKGCLKSAGSTGSSNGNAAMCVGTDGSLAARIDSSSSLSLLPYQGVLGSFASFRMAYSAKVPLLICLLPSPSTKTKKNDQAALPLAVGGVFFILK